MKRVVLPIISGSASLEKGLSLFSRIARDNGQTKLIELASDMSLPRSTLYRLAGALEKAGLITRLGRGQYAVGVRLLEGLQHLTPAGELARFCRPALQLLAKACSATAHLGVMENDMVTYLVKASAAKPSIAAAFTRENAQLEAYCSGIGKVLLAWLPEAELARYLSAGPFVALTKRTITNPAKLQACLQIVRTKQFARDDGEVADDLFCLAVPLWTRHLPMTAAISLSFNREVKATADEMACLKMLRACAAELGAKLGKN
jgi:IclR family acetate operon transcriptional repressor